MLIAFVIAICINNILRLAPNTLNILLILQWNEVRYCDAYEFFLHVYLLLIDLRMYTQKYSYNVEVFE